MRKGNKTYQILTVVLFGLLLLFPMLQSFFRFVPEKTVDGENRVLTERPDLNKTNLDAYPSQYDQYFNDNFPFRARFLDAFFTYSIFNHQSPIPAVILGKENFLFSGKEEQELYEGKLEFTEEQMDGVIEELMLRYDSLNCLGIKFYVFIAPTALEIYPEYLPVYVQRAPHTATDVFCEKMKQKASQIPYLYLKQSILNRKGNRLLYCKNDNHWNLLGGQVGTSAILDMLSKDFPMLPSSIQHDFEVKPYTRHSGNLASWLSSGKYAKLYQDDVDYKVSYKDAVECGLEEDTVQDYEPTLGFAYPFEYERQYRTNRMDHPKILVIRDSYCNAIIPYLSPYFRESLFIFDAWRYGANWDIVQKEKPDAVVLMIYEPHIRNIFRTL